MLFVVTANNVCLGIFRSMDDGIASIYQTGEEHEVRQLDPYHTRILVRQGEGELREEWEFCCQAITSISDGPSDGPLV